MLIYFVDNNYKNKQTDLRNSFLEVERTIKNYQY